MDKAKVPAAVVALEPVVVAVEARAVAVWAERDQAVVVWEAQVAHPPYCRSLGQAKHKKLYPGKRTCSGD